MGRPLEVEDRYLLPDQDVDRGGLGDEEEVAFVGEHHEVLDKGRIGREECEVGKEVVFASATGTKKSNGLLPVA